MTEKYTNFSAEIQKTTLDHLNSQKMQDESYDHLFNRILDEWEPEQKSNSEIEEATKLTNETLEGCKKELSGLFD
jgi:hypothetical protein